jgi:hypothetical protein
MRRGTNPATREVKHGQNEKHLHSTEERKEIGPTDCELKQNLRDDYRVIDKAKTRMSQPCHRAREPLQ